MYSISTAHNRHAFRRLWFQVCPWYLATYMLWLQRLSLNIFFDIKSWFSVSHCIVKDNKFEGKKIPFCRFLFLCITYIKKNIQMIKIKCFQMLQKLVIFLRSQFKDSYFDLHTHLSDCLSKKLSLKTCHDGKIYALWSQKCGKA